MTRNVVFDFGGVLVTWKPQDVVAGMFDDEGLQRTVLESVFHHQDWHELDRGTFTEPEIAGAFAARTGLGESVIHELLDRARDSLTLVPEMALLVLKLKRLGVPVYALSNMSESTFAHLESRYDIWSAFDGIVISARVGMIKPEPDIFEHLTAEFGLDRNQSIFIDDLAANVGSARALGFDTMLFNDPDQCERDLLARLTEAGD